MRITVHPKFDPSGIWTHDLQIIDCACHVPEMLVLTAEPSGTSFLPSQYFWGLMKRTAVLFLWKALFCEQATFHRKPWAMVQAQVYLLTSEQVNKTYTMGINKMMTRICTLNDIMGAEYQTNISFPSDDCHFGLSIRLLFNILDWRFRCSSILQLILSHYCVKLWHKCKLCKVTVG